MTYLLLWSSVERLCTLRYSLRKLRDDSILRRILRLAEEPAFISTVDSRAGAIKENMRRVYRSDDPDGAAAPTTPDDVPPEKVLKYLYTIRSNIAHRGKESMHDYELLRGCTGLLLTAFRAVLESSFERAKGADRRRRR